MAKKFNISKYKVTERMISSACSSIIDGMDPSELHPRLLFYCAARLRNTHQKEFMKIVAIARQRNKNNEFDNLGNWKFNEFEGVLNAQ